LLEKSIKKEHNLSMSKRQKEAKFTFIDLFAGIGGFHLALRDLGGECVFVNEFDARAKETYENNFRKNESWLFEDESREPYFWKSIKDITLTNTEDPKSVWVKNIKDVIPEFDILCAGFPCQPFSRIGKKRGFDDDRGTLFNDIERIILARQPKVIFLENVRNIITHNNGKTFESIVGKLKAAGYHVNQDRDDSWNMFRASDFGLPTARPRFYLVAFKENTPGAREFKFPDPTTPEGMTLRKFFKNKKWPDSIGRTIRVGGRGSPVYQKKNGEWFIDRRSWDTYIVGGKKHVLTIDEAKKMMGFSKTYRFPKTVTSTQAFKQLGNSVAVDVIRAIGKEIANFL
jgi:DNA (cytosine-5)-methyltransferase 1